MDITWKMHRFFLPNTIGGYMPGPQERPGKNIHGKTNATFFALLHGYVVVSAGARGREMEDADGKFLGCAPAALCDLKAAIRFLRHNAETIPGDVNKIIPTEPVQAGQCLLFLEVQVIIRTMSHI